MSCARCQIFWFLLMDAEIYVKALRMWLRCIPLQSLQQWSHIKVFLTTQLSSQNVLYMYIHYVKIATVDFVSISWGNTLPALSLHLESFSMIPVLSSHLVSLYMMIQYACTSFLRRTMSFSCQSNLITFTRSMRSEIEFTWMCETSGARIQQTC